MFEQVNVAIQVLPQSGTKAPYVIIDRIIQHIQQSGLRYRVCPFETVVEGSFDAIMVLIREIQEIGIQAGAQKMLTNIKIEIHASGQVSIDDKMAKYEKGGD